MKSTLSSLLLCLVIIGSTSIKIVSGQSEDICIDEINSLEEIDEVMDATMIMLDAYNETCTKNGKCTASAEPGTAITKNDYTTLVMSNSLGRMETACNGIVPGSTLCLVTNEVLKGGLKTIELNKPVCVPPSCDEGSSSDIRLLDPNPGSCDPSSTSEPCEVLSTAVMCPELRPEQFDSGQCETDANAISSSGALNPFLGALRNAVVRACISVLLGQESDLCQISTPLFVTGMKDFTDIDTLGMKEYEDFEKKCKNSPSPTTLCKMSVDISAAESEAFIDIETDLIYTDIPLCLPETCAEIDPVSIAQEQLVKDNFKCDSVTSFCQVEVSKFSCSSDTEISSTTSSPTSASIPDTSPPTFVKSSTPTMKGSMAPSIHTSGVPTIFKSSAPTTMESLGPSTAPPKSIATFPPSSSPTAMDSTSAPTVVVSFSPSADEGDKIPSDIFNGKNTGLEDETDTEEIIEIIAVETSGSDTLSVRWIKNCAIYTICAISSIWLIL